jgi:hypothetical protein
VEGDRAGENTKPLDCGLRGLWEQQVGRWGGPIVTAVEHCE